MDRGFTGTRQLTNERRVLLHARLAELVQQGLDHAITGACVGVDAEIVWHLLKIAPQVEHTIVVPHDRKGVDHKLLELDGVEFVFMPEGTDYRARNTKIVELSSGVEAFWTGQQAYSGTYMTINIAKRADKLRHITRF